MPAPVKVISVVGDTAKVPTPVLAISNTVPLLTPTLCSVVPDRSPAGSAIRPSCGLSPVPLNVTSVARIGTAVARRWS